MSWTKRQLITQAFEEIGLSGDYTIAAEQYQTALRKLDALMGTWNARGLRLGYPLVSDPATSDIDADSGLPDSALEAAYLNLAIRLAPLIGRTISRETKVSARQAYQCLITRSTFPNQMQIANLPSGAGHKSFGDSSYRFLRPPSDPLEAGPDAELDFE